MTCRNRFLLFVSLGSILGGCAGSQHSSAPRIAAAQIAVLPVENETKDPDGPLVIRHLLERWLAERGYVTVPEVVVDRELSAMTIKNGSELTPSTLQDLAKRTGADAVAEATLLDFRSSNSGFNHARRVAATIRLVNAQTGKVLWQSADQEGAKGSTINPEKALYEYVKGWGTAAIEKALNSPLYPESNKLIGRMLKGLPSYSAEG